MTITATATVENDISFTIIQAGSNTQNESASLNYSLSLSDGTGSLNVNYGVVASGSLSAGAKEYFDFYALSKTVLNASTTIQFSKIKAVAVYNSETTYGRDIAVYATGGDGLTELFNGGSGNLLVKPKAVYQYSDPISGVVVSSSTRKLTIEDKGGAGAAWKMVVVGVTG